MHSHAGKRMKRALGITALLAGLGAAAGPALAQATAVVDASVQYQTFEGFGTSLSWWANGVGSWSEPARSARADDRLTFATPTLARGTHTIKVRVTGLKNHNAGGAVVQADRIDVVN
jgi:hypothetical protein